MQNRLPLRGGRFNIELQTDIGKRIKKIMKKIFIYSSVVVLILIVVGSLVYAYFQKSDPDFWKNTVGNLLATLVGLAVGVPVGLWINRSIESEQIEKREKEKCESELGILKLIREEIEFCNNCVFPYRPTTANSFLGVPYKTATWDVLCASTEVGYISSPKLLNQIAYAYHHIKAQDRIEYRIQNAFTAGKISEANQLIGIVRGLDPQFIAQVGDALKDINIRIKELETLIILQ